MALEVHLILVFNKFQKAKANMNVQSQKEADLLLKTEHVKYRQSGRVCFWGDLLVVFRSGKVSHRHIVSVRGSSGMVQPSGA